MEKLCIFYPICIALILVLHKLEGFLCLGEYPENTFLKDGDTFDYVVVGAGPAGCAAASRLSLAGHQVLLVEKGGNPPEISKIPGAAPILMGSPFDWKYKTISNNKSCLSTPCTFFSGKCLGGSSSINHMIYSRGNPLDFQYNLPGWTWNELKPYFLRSEGLQSLNKLPETSKQYHNTSGSMNITIMDDSDSPWHPRLLDSYKHLGIPQNDDLNGASQIGVGIVPVYVYNGERMSAARGYLTRDDVKRNLKVAKDTLCIGVIIENLVAKGVKLIQVPGKTIKVFARQEVILSAGAVGTPQILMLSGIGPADHLREKNIPLVADLPVGDSLIDHFSAVMIGLVDKSSGIVGDLSSFAGIGVDVADYIVKKKGLFSTIGLSDLTLFVNTSCYNSKTKVLENGPGCDVPNLQIVHVYVNQYFLTIGKPFMQYILNPSQAVADQLAAASAKYGIIMFAPLILNPYSRGKIRLASADPTESPEITPNFLSDDRDITQNLEAISIIEDLFETKVFRDKGAQLLKFKLDCPDYDLDKAGYWECYIRHITNSGLHAVGTAAIGTVLDEKLRVFNISCLRVADLSIFRIIPKGNTEATALVAGERVVDFIMEDYPV